MAKHDDEFKIEAAHRVKMQSLLTGSSQRMEPTGTIYLSKKTRTIRNAAELRQKLPESYASQFINGRSHYGPPEHGFTTDESVMIPMRDGTRLSTDLYFPVGAADKLPTILFRDPYNKNRGRETSGESVRSTEHTYFYASHGFVVAKQDSRGKHESEGVYSPPHGNEATDGYDTVDWIAKQPWSNSKVGTGGAYPGETQMLQAPLMNPHLTAMIRRQLAGPSERPAVNITTGRAVAACSDHRAG